MRAAPLELDLPWPPSVNHYWLRYRHAVVVAPEGRKYRAAAALAIRAQAPGARTMADRLSVEIVAAPPDRRRRDLDNLPKAVLDALVAVRLIDDDSLIDELTVRRVAVESGGRLRVRIQAIGKE